MGIVSRHAICALVGLCLFIPRVASAALYASTAAGAPGELYIISQADGSLAAENASIAHPFQARTETVTTLTNLSSTPLAVVDSVAGQGEGATEILARKVVVLAPLGRDVSSAVAALISASSCAAPPHQ